MATKFKNSVEIDGYLSISSGNWIQVPDGTTAQRPGSPAVGMFRYNTTTDKFEGYFGSTPAWGEIGGGGGGGTVTEAFKTFAVSGQTSIVADGPTDTLTVAAGSNISLTTNAATDTLTIASTASGGGSGVTVQRNNYTADGSTVAYGISSTVVTENNLQVYLDGVYQDKDTFTATGTTLTFGTAPLSGTEIEIMHFVSIDGVIAVDEYIGNGSTINFNSSLSITNENATQVYLDGVYQSKTTYSTTGNVVTFTTAPPTGTTVEIVHMKAVDSSVLSVNNFTGNGSLVNFTLSTTVTDENLTFVFINGVYQDKSTYSISGTTLTFSTAPQNSYGVEVMVISAVTIGAAAASTVVTGGAGISVVTNSLNNFTITNSAPSTDWVTAIKASNFTAVASKGYFVNTTSAAITVTLPVGVVGTEILIQDYAGTFATNKVIFAANGSEKIQGVTDDFKCITNNATVTLVYQDATKGWTSQDITELSQNLSVDYLLVAGGGAGIQGAGGGGGLLTTTNYGGTESVLTLTTGTNYAVTIGAGGSAPSSVQNTAIAQQGSNSIFSSIISIGGGGGGGSNTTANSFMNGGSGGGGTGAIAGSNFVGGTGVSGPPRQGFDGGIGRLTSTGGAGQSDGPGGGGGATALGANGTKDGTYEIGGAGGAGKTVGITNVNLGYAGGGGGTTFVGSIAGGGATDGGGTGGSGSGSPAGVSGAANKGGGGGGGAAGTMGSGGSGVVVLRYTSGFTLTVPAGLTATTTTVGSIKITIFTAGTGNVQFN